MLADEAASDAARARVLQSAGRLLDSIPLDPTSVSRLRPRPQSGAATRSQTTLSSGVTHKTMSDRAGLTDFASGEDAMRADDAFRKQIDQNLGLMILPSTRNNAIFLNFKILS